MRMGRLCRAALDPGAWRRQAGRLRVGLERKVLWRRLNDAFRRHLRLPSAAEGATVLADGLWDNPNQFFRLRLFLEALAPESRQQLAAVLRTPGDRSRETLEALGFTRFFCLSDDPVSPADRAAARSLLAGVRSHADLLGLPMPGGLPADIFYDTALKLARHAQPALDHPVWTECLADVFRLHRFYARVFGAIDVRTVVLSHPWKNEFGAALWCALSNGVTSFHLNGMYEVMRIRRFDRADQFFVPMEAMSAAEFAALPKPAQSNLAAAGMAYLDERAQGTNSDINQVLAYRNPEAGAALRARLGIPADRPVALICCHVWYDFPHSFGMRNFTDFRDWTAAVLGVAYGKDDVTWLIKPHPTESWYGGFRLADLTGTPPEHVRVLDEDVSVLAALEIAAAVVTVHGTVAVEAAARGIPVLCADKSLFSDWEFSVVAASRDEFLQRLSAIETLPAPDPQQIARAAAYAYLAVGPGEPETGLLRLPADHVAPARMFGNLLALATNGGVVRQQGRLIADWLDSGSSSFAVHHKVRLHDARPHDAVELQGIGNNA